MKVNELVAERGRRGKSAAACGERECVLKVEKRNALLSVRADADDIATKSEGLVSKLTVFSSLHVKLVFAFKPQPPRKRRQAVILFPPDRCYAVWRTHH
ncbi:MAG: hypothetical protein ACKESB_01115 [Candidatus Hodgkinia cicadicola]